VAIAFVKTDATIVRVEMQIAFVQEHAMETILVTA
jgi:hypothetical protein